MIEGLGKTEKMLPCKYLYDERGSRLFDEICELDEYYVTRTELAIMQQDVHEMALQLGERVMLIEFGSGSSIKTRILLEHLIDPAAYVPVDISETHLLKTAENLRNQFPGLEVLPVVADFTEAFDLPQTTIEPSHAAIYFPGSTIGNFAPTEAANMMSRIAEFLGMDGGMLIGIDLQKDPAVIHAAYNDAKGVTAEFNLNILHRVNRELGANFDIDQFAHLAEYSQTTGRVELFVVSQCEQTVKIGDRFFQFADGERIFTEYSHKYTIDGFTELAQTAGFSLHKYWTDERKMFAVLHLVVQNLDE
ncbi:MAG: L-histidine N(alpha)-methyltransferase [Pirellulaceae bacterium]